MALTRPTVRSRSTPRNVTWRRVSGAAAGPEERPGIGPLVHIWFTAGAGRARAVSDDVKSRLDTMRICTDGQVESVIVCRVIDGIGTHLLAKDPGLYWRPYYNTPLVPMLRAYANEQIVRMHAFLCGSGLCKTCRAAGKKQKTCTGVRCGKPITDGIAIRGLEDLKNHRDVLGHPLTWHLDRRGVRQFVDAKRDRYDVRPAPLWDIHRSIVDAQVAAGVSATALDLKFGPTKPACSTAFSGCASSPTSPPSRKLQWPRS
jgi:hypothetical protein